MNTWTFLFDADSLAVLRRCGVDDDLADAREAVVGQCVGCVGVVGHVSIGKGNEPGALQLPWLTESLGLGDASVASVLPRGGESTAGELARELVERFKGTAMYKKMHGQALAAMLGTKEERQRLDGLDRWVVPGLDCTGRVFPMTYDLVAAEDPDFLPELGSWHKLMLGDDFPNESPHEVVRDLLSRVFVNQCEGDGGSIVEVGRRLLGGEWVATSSWQRELSESDGLEAVVVDVLAARIEKMYAEYPPAVDMPGLLRD